MRFTKLTVVMMSFVIMASCQEQGSSTKIKKLVTDRDSVSYALGIQYSSEVLNWLKSQGIDGEFEKNMIIAGFADNFSGNPLLIDAERSAVLFNDYMQQIMAVRRAVQEAESAKTHEENKTKGEEFLAQNAKRKEITITKSGLQYEVLKKGTGKVPKATDKVKVNYKGTLIDGTVFDQNDGIVFGVTQVIPGWVEALQLMPTGSKWKLYIPQEIAYGQRQAGQHIKPYSALIFEIELIGIE